MRETLTIKVVKMLDAKGAGVCWARSCGLFGPLVGCRLNSYCQSLCEYEVSCKFKCHQSKSFKGGSTNQYKGFSGGSTQLTRLAMVGDGELEGVAH